jgi:hypothetical protein
VIITNVNQATAQYSAFDLRADRHGPKPQAPQPGCDLHGAAQLTNFVAPETGNIDGEGLTWRHEGCTDWRRSGKMQRRRGLLERRGGTSEARANPADKAKQIQKLPLY